MNNYFITCVKKEIQQLIPYEPGKPIEEVARHMGISESDIIKLASNENPLGISPEAQKIITENQSDLFRYPDGNAFVLKNALSDHLGVDTHLITLGNGSDELLRLLALAYAGPGDEIIFSQYAFAIYMIATLSVGAKPVVVPARSWGCDINKITEAVNEKTRIIYIANPNNPTGTWLPPDEIQLLLNRVDPGVIVVLDEAYIEYISDTDIQDSLSWINNHPNLVITRTFSKAYGMAGLRIGYAIANAHISDIVNRVRPAFNVNSMAQKIAVAALNDHEFIKRSQKNNHEGMQQLQVGFKALGLDYIPSKGNFVAVDVACDSQQIFQQLLRVGVIVRPLSGYNMPQHIRVTIGTPRENALFLKALSQVLQK